MPVTTRDPALVECAQAVTDEFETRCPVARYRIGSPGDTMVLDAVYSMLEAGIIEIGPHLKRTEQRFGDFRG